MVGINYSRLIAGGLVAGLVANVLDFVSNTVFLADDVARMAQRLGLDQHVIASTNVALTWVAVDFVYGLLIVWTYAAVRPRFGPGPATAVKAGLVLWASVAVVLFGFTSMGVFTPDTFYKSSALSLVSSVAAALAGASVYRD